jgi:Protein of unknown function (DUF2970)
VTDSGHCQQKRGAWRPPLCRDPRRSEIAAANDSAHHCGMPQQDSHSPPDAETSRQAGFVQVMGAVFWSFFGIRKKAAGERDAVSIKPVHVIVAGLLGAALLVMLVLTLVHFIVRAA